MKATHSMGNLKRCFCQCQILWKCVEMKKMVQNDKKMTWKCTFCTKLNDLYDVLTLVSMNLQIDVSHTEEGGLHFVPPFVLLLERNW